MALTPLIGFKFRFVMPLLTKISNLQYKCNANAKNILFHILSVPFFLFSMEDGVTLDGFITSQQTFL